MHHVDPRTGAGVRRLTVAVVAVLALAGAAACSADDAGTSIGGDATVDVADTSSGGTVTPPDSTAAIDPGLQPYIDIAVADLAARLQVEAASITPLSAVLIVWPDTSLGCPAPGMQYPQVATDGARIQLEVDGRTYDYHAGGDTTPFLCDPKSGPASTTAGG